jgi:ABC-type Fe3+/spermidine/putrescine transport system ATPase subunit
MTRVSIAAVSKSFPGNLKSAVSELSVEITSGELAVFVGPSGCGKTTLMRMIAGLLAPTSGDIRFDGASVLSVPAERRSAVMVFQNHLLFPYMTVADNVGFGLRMRNIATADIDRRVREMLDLVKLADLGQRRPSELSGGQQQRAALARALIVDPAVLLLDEPLSNLDAHLRSEMRVLIKSLQRERKITTILVTHDQEEATILADRLILMIDGQLRQHGAPITFYDRPADEDVARFFGGSNFVFGESGGGVFVSPLGHLRLPREARTGPGKLTFRPESVKLGLCGENTLTVMVSSVLFVGTQVRLELCVNGLVIEAAVNPHDAAGYQVGDEIPISLPSSSLWVLN